jgi:hypothetical protein
LLFLEPESSRECPLIPPFPSQNGTPSSGGESIEVGAAMVGI